MTAAPAPSTEILFPGRGAFFTLDPIEFFLNAEKRLNPLEISLDFPADQAY